MIVGGLLGPFEDLLAKYLEILHGLGISWAWSIVVLTVSVRMLLVPLTVKQIHSMQRLQAHAPEMKALQQQWKHDKQRQREELMKFYSQNKINPASSCLPIVAQIPIFIALFFVLRDFEKEILPRYPGSELEWLNLINIIEPARHGWGPLMLAIYVTSQLLSTFLMSTTMERSQRIIMLVLPVLFLPFILSFQAGLVLYWVTTNLWTTGQGLVTRRLMPRPANLPTQKRSSRTPPKDGGTGGGAREDRPKPSAPSARPRQVKRKKKARR